MMESPSLGLRVPIFDYLKARGFVSRFFGFCECYPIIAPEHLANRLHHAFGVLADVTGSGFQKTFTISQSGQFHGDKPHTVD